MNIKCIIVDDEPLAINKIKAFVDKVPFLQSQGEFMSGFDALEFLHQNDIDLLFLDIQMNDITGIQLLEVLKKKPLVIFTTAYEQYAVKGFELDICDYLLKPISFERFLHAANKAYEIISIHQPKESIKKVQENSNTGHIPAKKDFIFLKTEYRMQKVAFNDILYVQGMKDYLLVKTATSNIMTIMTFKKLEEMLPHKDFFRIHKSYIVPINKIESIERNHVKIGNKMLPISETYKKEFFDQMQKYGNFIG